MSKRIFKISLALIFVAVFLSACSLPWKKKAVLDNQNLVLNETPVEDTTSYEGVVKKFSSQEELKKFLEDHQGKQNYTLATTRATLGFDSSKAALSSEGVSLESKEGGADFSGTNNQVTGVDEADIIKTDGNYIYALVRQDLKIIKVNPAGEAAVISTISFKSRPQDIFISGGSLVVFGSDEQIYTLAAFDSFLPQDPFVFFKVFDLANPAEPRLVRDLKFEGSYNEARLLGDYVYLLTTSAASSGDDDSLLPRVFDGENVLATDCTFSEKCFAPDVYYFDVPYDWLSFTNITAINVRNHEEALSGQSYLMSAAQTLYVSEKNIYITATQYLSEYELEQTVKRELIFSRLSGEDQDKIRQIEAAPKFILSAQEKKMKVALIIEAYLHGLGEEQQALVQIEVDSALKQKLAAASDDLEKTVIHKIAINGRQIEYRAQGEVPGQVLNQFSLDENGDYLRLATTRNEIWSRLSEKPENSYSNVFVLDQDLKLVGSLKNLATTEKIYAARFMGDRVYLVTFKKTDPLYVIGLADPAKPTVLGAVKVPGFSNYLHPADASGEKLIGFGRDASDEGEVVTVKGLKLALFDFSDLSRPRELDSYLIGDSGSDSIALSDHKAFLYSAAKNLLVLPAVLKEGDKLGFAGALVFNITDNRFVLKGKIDHSAGGQYAASDYFRGFSYYDNTVKRSLYINDNLYTFSNQALRINRLADLSPVKDVILTSGGDDYTITPTPVKVPLEEPAQSPDPGVSSSTTEISPVGQEVPPAISSSTSGVNLTPLAPTSTPNLP